MAEFKEGTPTDGGRYAVELVKITSTGTQAACGQEGKWTILVHDVVGNQIVETRLILEDRDQSVVEKALPLVVESRAYAFCLGRPFVWKSDAS